jgi:ethanolamine utilization protein EutQ
VSRQVHTAEDVLRLAGRGETELVVGPGELVTPLARDVARDKGVRIVASVPVPTAPRPQPHPPLLHHVTGVNVMPLKPFPVELHRPEMDVQLTDVVTAEHGMPMAAGVMSLRQGSFGWALDYDEVEYVIEGELHITTEQQRVVGRPGDVIAIPKGSRITFGTPSWTRFLYVTYPADWGGGS